MTSPEIRGNRFQGVSLEQKYNWMQQGPGAASLGDQRAELGGLGEDLGQSEDMLRSAVAQFGGSWEGDAAASAGSQMIAAAQWTSESADNTRMSSVSVDDQIAVADRTKYAVPKPPDLSQGFMDEVGDAFKSPFAVFGVTTDAQQKAEAYRRADQQATQALQDYESSSRSNVGAMAPMSEPPKIAVGKAEVATPPSPRPVDQSTSYSSFTAKTGTVPPRHSGTDPLPGRQPVQPPPRVPVSPPVRPPGTPIPPGRPPMIPSAVPAPKTVTSGYVPPDPGSVGGGTGGTGGGLAGGFGANPGSAPSGGPATGARPGGFGPVGSGAALSDAGRAGGAGGAGGAARQGGMSPGAGGRGGGKPEEDQEHTDDYAVATDDFFLDDTMTAPPVIGE